MIDTPAAPASPSVAASDLLQPEKPAMTPEQAARQKHRMLSDPGFAAAVARGDPHESRKWKEVNRALNPPVDQATAEGRQYARNMDALAYFRANAELSPAVLDQVAAGGPVSLEERQEAIFMKQRLFSDKNFVRRVLDGDREAKTQMTLVNMVLASPIGTAEQINNFNAAAAKRLSGRTK
jgi:hypothetical protein